MSFRTTEEKSTLEIFNVENTFLGMTITEKQGLSMRRVALELKDITETKRLRDFLTT